MREAFDHHQVFSRTHTVGALAAGTRSYCGHDAWPQLEQPLKVAAIQRQRENRFVADGSTQGSVRGVDRGNFSGDGYGLVLLSRLHHQIDPNILAHLHHDARVLDGLKSFGLCANRVGAGGQIVGRVFTSAIGNQGSRHASGRIGDRYSCTANSTAALIKYRTLNSALIGL